MEDAAFALLIIVSTTLSIFLIVAIVALVKINQILGDTHRIAQKAEKIVDKADSVSDFFQKSAGPVAIAKILSSVVGSFTNNKSDQKGKGGDSV